MKVRKQHLENIKRVPNPGGNRLRTVRLDKNERTIRFSETDWQEMLAPIVKNPEWITAYPEVKPLIQKIAAWDGVNDDQIFLTAGSDLALKACFESFVSPGDKVVLLEPTFAMGNVYCQLFQAQQKAIPCKNDMSYGLNDLIAAVDSDTAFVYLPNPNSPTGGEFSLSELDQLLAHCQSKSVPVFVDEAYYFFSKTTALPLVKKYENLVVGRTFSKACGLAGVRLGYAAGQKEIIDLVGKWRPMYEVNSFAIQFGTYLIEHPYLIDKYVEKVQAAKEQVMSWCFAKDVPFFKSAANFINVKVGEANAKEIEKACLENNILLKGGAPYKPGNECVRISLGVPEQVDLLLPIMEKVLGISK